MIIKCHWFHPENGPYSTQCGKEFGFEDKSEADSKGFKFCPFCGGSIKLTKDEEPAEA